MLNDSSDPIDPIEPAQKQQAAKGVPWGPWVAVLYAVAVFLIAQVVAGLVVYVGLRAFFPNRTINAINNLLNNSVTVQFFYVLLAEALTFGAVWWFMRRRHASLQLIGWRRLRPQDVVAAFAGLFVYFVLYSVILSVAMHLFSGINTSQKQQLGFTGAHGGLELTLTFLSLVVLPPLVEETVFRGFMFTGLRGKMRWVWAALITSAVFATAHLEFGSGAPLLWSAAIDTFCLSLVLCYLRQETDSLWPGILLHGLKNSIAFLYLFNLFH